MNAIGERRPGLAALPFAIRPDGAMSVGRSGALTIVAPPSHDRLSETVLSPASGGRLASDGTAATSP
jgi:hypothetical protein